MELNWLECLIYGLISGICEFLPVSSLAHQTVYLKLLGKQDHPLFQLCAMLGAFLALMIYATPILLRIRRERRIAMTPKKNRRRQPDFATLMEGRVLRLTAMTVLAMFIGYSLVCRLHERLWVLAALLAVNGIVLYVPQYLPGANKGAQSLSGLDALLIGIAAGCGMIPGISRVGATISVACVRGADQRYAADLSLLLSVPALLLMMVVTLISVISAAGTAIAVHWFSCVTVTAATFASAYFAIFLLRFLSVRAGYGTFGYYSWGLALFSLIIYLI